MCFPWLKLFVFIGNEKHFADSNFNCFFVWMSFGNSPFVKI